MSLEIFNGTDTTFRNIVKKIWYKYLYCTIGLSVADVVLKGFFHSRVENKTECSPTFTFLNSFSLLTLPTKMPPDYMQTHPLWLRKCRSHQPPDIGVVFWKNVMIRFTLYLHSPWASALAVLETGCWAKQAVGCSYISTSYAVHHDIRAWYCLFFGPSYKLVFQKTMKGI